MSFSCFRHWSLNWYLSQFLYATPESPFSIANVRFTIWKISSHSFLMGFSTTTLSMSTFMMTFTARSPVREWVWTRYQGVFGGKEEQRVVKCIWADCGIGQEEDGSLEWHSLDKKILQEVWACQLGIVFVKRLMKYFFSGRYLMSCTCRCLTTTEKYRKTAEKSRWKIGILLICLELNFQVPLWTGCRISSHKLQYKTSL